MGEGVGKGGGVEYLPVWKMIHYHIDLLAKWEIEKKTFHVYKYLGKKWELIYLLLQRQMEWLSISMARINQVFPNIII